MAGSVMAQVARPHQEGTVGAYMYPSYVSLIRAVEGSVALERAVFR